MPLLQYENVKKEITKKAWWVHWEMEKGNIRTLADFIRTFCLIRESRTVSYVNRNWQFGTLVK